MRYQYRITKYDPCLRNEAGSYLRDEWTSCSDIGKVFSGVKLEANVYINVESAYLSAIESFLYEARLPGLLLKGLENRCESIVPEFIREGNLLSIPQCVEFSQMVLREQVWGKLTDPGKAYVHFGWDYYMYIGVPVACHSSIELAKRDGLFVEPIRSPYLRARVL